MADLSNFLNGGGLRLAPDLNFISNTQGRFGVDQAVSFNPQGSLTTALSLTGKFAIAQLEFQNLIAETVTVELIIDGVTIINETFVNSTRITILNTPSGRVVSNDLTLPPSIGCIVCNSSLLLRLQTATDTSVILEYLARPIL